MYYISRKLACDFETTLEKVVFRLKENGFGIVSDLDVTKIFKEKINMDFRKYRILGACNPHSAFHALNTDDKIGVLLPCNVILQECADGQTEIAVIDPVSQFQVVGRDDLQTTALEVKLILEKAISEV
jgi:uncharacterized protein (DUF302 family)